jgi:hypothetical protein
LLALIAPWLMTLVALSASSPGVWSVPTLVKVPATAISSSLSLARDGPVL